MPLLATVDLTGSSFHSQAMSIEPPSVQFEADKSAISLSESVSIVCEASGGYPFVSSITIEKGGRTVASAASGSAEVNTEELSEGPFGEFRCVVDNSVVVVERTLQIQERGITIYTLLKMGRYYNTTMCHYWDMLVK